MILDMKYVINRLGRSILIVTNPERVFSTIKITNTQSNTVLVATFRVENVQNVSR